MLDDDDGEAAPVQMLEHARRLQRLLGRQAGGRLVEQEDVRPAGQDHGDLEPLQAMVRQLAGQHVGLGLEAEQIERVAEALLGEGRARAADRRGDLEVLPDRQGVVGAVGLEGEAQALAHAPEGRQPRHVRTLEDDAAGVRGIDPAEEREEGRLAGTVGADDAAQLALGDGERDAVGRHDAAEALGELPGSRGSPPPSQRLPASGAKAARQPRRGSSRARVTMMPRGKNIITSTSSAPVMTIAYWLPVEDSV